MTLFGKRCYKLTRIDDQIIGEYKIAISIVGDLVKRWEISIEEAICLADLEYDRIIKRHKNELN